MDPIITAGLISAGGSLLQGLFGQSSAQTSMDFQKEVLQNRNQWMVEDLKKAGLNPILAAGATSSGSASGAQSHIDNPGEKAVSSAVQAKMADIAKENMILQNKKTESEIALNSAETAKKWSEAEFIAPTAQANISALGASADVNRQNIVESQARVETIHGQLSKLEQEVENLVAERDEILARTKTAHSQTLKTTLEARYFRAQEKLTQKLEEGRALANEGQKITNILASFDVPRAKEKAEFYNTTWGKWVFKIGETVKSLSPFVPKTSIGINK